MHTCTHDVKISARKMTTYRAVSSTSRLPHSHSSLCPQPRTLAKARVATWHSWAAQAVMCQIPAEHGFGLLLKLVHQCPHRKHHVETCDWKYDIPKLLRSRSQAEIDDKKENSQKKQHRTPSPRQWFGLTRRSALVVPSCLNCKGRVSWALSRSL